MKIEENKMTDSARWYIVNVYSGYEKKFEEYVHEHASKNGLSDFFKEILIPTEEVIETRRKNKKVNIEKKYFPGYVLVKMVLNSETWRLVRDAPRVSGFLGSKEKPSIIRESEVDRIRQQIQDAIEKPRHTVSYEMGELVRVCDGPFNSFTGSVEEVDSERNRLKVSVTIFGRPTLVDLDFSQVEKT
jgi:transcriptional antiterminator NusG